MGAAGHHALLAEMGTIESGCCPYTGTTTRLVGVAAVTALLPLAVGCGDGNRGAYVKANEHLFASLPSFPGTRVESETSTAYHSGGDGGGPVAGYGTRFALTLPDTAGVPSVAAFFRKALQPRWRLVETLPGPDGPVLNFRRGKAEVSVNLEGGEGHVLEIDVDHAYSGKVDR